MNKVDRILAEKLLKIKAVKLQPDNPFTWGSGWLSPVYTDNRKLLSYPAVRSFVKIELSRMILEHFGGVEAIAGVATGAIAHGAIVADCLDLPFAFVRLTPKDHGLENLIEGSLKLGQKAVVVEDNISTAHNSVKVIEALRSAGCEVLGVVSLFTYGFPQSEVTLRKAGVPMVALTSFDTLVDTALELKEITPDMARTLREWQRDPENWTN